MFYNHQGKKNEIHPTGLNLISINNIKFKYCIILLKQSSLHAIYSLVTSFLRYSVGSILYSSLKSLAKYFGLLKPT